MEELSIEEKAKAYDEALKVLHKYDGANIMFTQDLKEEMFPELKESEEERIRKLLLEAVTQVLQDQYCYNRGVSKEKVVAWLEKQGEQKSDNKADSIIYSYIPPNPEFFQWIYDRLINVHNENPSVDYMLSLKKRIEDMQNPINDDMKEALQTEYEKGRADAIAEMQKTWSEEDEVNLNEALSYIKDDALKEFIKSLKDRVQPQPKQEWSEEDEEEANYIADFIENLIKKEKLVSKKTMVMEEMVAWLRDIKYSYLPKPEQGWGEEDEKMLNDIIMCGEHHCYLDAGNIAWLKSLRPQNTWKPSDEQIKALNEAIYHVDDSVATQIAMLIGELSKL